MTRFLHMVATAALMVTTSTMAVAAYPERPITLVIGYTAGGPTDAVGRYLAKKLTAELGQPVVVENRPGANGVLALRGVKRAIPDGYTLMLGSSGPLSIEPVYKQKVDYNVLDDFTAVGLVASYPYVLVVPQDSPFKTTQDLIAGARAKPDALTFASAGNGAVNHLAAERFASATNVKIRHIPYKGDSAAVADLVGGRVDMAFLSVIAAMPQIQGGKLRGLAVAAPQPTPVAPGLETVAQVAGIAGFAAEPWNGVLAPKGLPTDIRDKLNAAINKVMSSEDARTNLQSLGQFPLTSTPDEFANHIQTQMNRWRQVITTAKIPQGE